MERRGSSLVVFVDACRRCAREGARVVGSFVVGVRAGENGAARDPRGFLLGAVQVRR